MVSLSFFKFFLRLSSCEINALDIGLVEKYSLKDIDEMSLQSGLILHKCVYKKMMERFNNGHFLPLKVETYCDAPPGSGLGSSSSLVVSMIEAYSRFLSIKLNKYELAELAYEIERIDCKFDGGKQDQYASSFGGFNFIDFKKNEEVKVKKLDVESKYINELESSITLFFMGVSRDSSKIIRDQIDNTRLDPSKLESMHYLKKNAQEMKDKLLNGEIQDMIKSFGDSWNAKKNTSNFITNKAIDDLEEDAKKHGAKSMKISGAGGGGFAMIFSDPEKKIALRNCLEIKNGKIMMFKFTDTGVFSWKT